MFMIPIAKPSIGEEEKKAVLEVLDSGLLSQGKKVLEFEEKFAKFVKVKHAVATSNGTTALHLALLANGIKPGDEVITTPFTFIATANAIKYVGAKPVFVDISDDFNINVELIEDKISDKTKAIIPVHLYGKPCDMKSITEISSRYGLKIIEDACQAHGANISGKYVGSFGTGCFSFYPTKNMTAAEGGIVTTNDDLVAENLRMLRAHGMKVRYYHDTLGYNFRMTDVHAAIGVEQLNKLPKFNELRAKNAEYLSNELSNVKGIVVPKLDEGFNHVFHQFTIRVTPEFKLNREELSKYLSDKGIGSMVYYPVPLHKQKSFSAEGYHNESYPVTEQFSSQVLSLPVYPGLTKDELDKIINTIKEVA